MAFLLHPPPPTAPVPHCAAINRAAAVPGLHPAREINRAGWASPAPGIASSPALSQSWLGGSWRHGEGGVMVPHSPQPFSFPLGCSLLRHPASGTAEGCPQLGGCPGAGGSPRGRCIRVVPRSRFNEQRVPPRLGHAKANGAVPAMVPSAHQHSGGCRGFSSPQGGGGSAGCLRCTGAVLSHGGGRGHPRHASVAWVTPQPSLGFGSRVGDVRGGSSYLKPHPQHPRSHASPGTPASPWSKHPPQT